MFYNNWYLGELVNAQDMLTNINANIGESVYGFCGGIPTVVGVKPTINAGAINITEGYAYFGKSTDSGYIHGTGTAIVSGEIAAQNGIALIAQDCYLYAKYQLVNSPDNRTTGVQSIIYTSVNDADEGVRFADIVGGKITGVYSKFLTTGDGGDFNAEAQVAQNIRQITQEDNFKLMRNDYLNQSVNYRLFLNTNSYQLDFQVCIWDNPDSTDSVVIELVDYQGNMTIINSEQKGGYWKITTDQKRWYKIYIDAQDYVTAPAPIEAYVQTNNSGTVAPNASVRLQLSNLISNSSQITISGDKINLPSNKKFIVTYYGAGGFVGTPTGESVISCTIQSNTGSFPAPSVPAYIMLSSTTQNNSGVASAYVDTGTPFTDIGILVRNSTSSTNNIQVLISNITIKELI